MLGLRCGRTLRRQQNKLLLLVDLRNTVEAAYILDNNLGWTFLFLYADLRLAQAPSVPWRRPQA